jgi:hypothetical protein
VSIKDQFESHPVVWGLSLIVAGFIGGFSARGYVPSSTVQPLSLGGVTCRVEGLNGVEQAHDGRIAAFQKQLIDLESKASDQTIISAYQDRYKESAERVRHDIAIENAEYQSAVQSLARKCQ